MDARWIQNASRRRIAFAVAAAIFAVLSVFPQHYTARVKIVPDLSGQNLGGALSQIGGLTSLSSLIGGATVEIYLNICRGHDVLRDVSQRLHLANRWSNGDERRAEVRLMHKMDIQSERGGIVVIQASDPDPAFAQTLVSTYSDAFHDRMTSLSFQQSGLKKAVLSKRLGEAAAKLADAEGMLNQFRTDNKLALPDVQLGVGVSQLAALQGQLQAKEVELQTVSQFATPDNIQVKQVQSEIVALQQQISRAQSSSPDAGGNNAQGLALKQFKYMDLYRYVQFSQSLYEIYQRYLEAANVEETSASINTQTIENAHVEPERRLNMAALGLLVAVLTAAFCAEYYIPRQDT